MGKYASLKNNVNLQLNVNTGFKLSQDSDTSSIIIKRKKSEHLLRLLFHNINKIMHQPTMYKRSLKICNKYEKLKHLFTNQNELPLHHPQFNLRFRLNNFTNVCSHENNESTSTYFIC